MKLPKLPTCLSSLTVAILAMTSFGARAQDGGPTIGTAPSLVISLEALTNLTAPPTTPVGVAAAAVITPVPTTGPTGGAALEAINVDGKKNAAIQLSARGLAADTYTIAITKKSDGTVVTLGTAVVAAVVPPVAAAAAVAPVAPIDADGDNDGSTGFGHFGGKRGSRINVRYGSWFGTPLPDGFDGFDVASITVTGSTGTVALSGSLTKTTEVVKRASLTADASAPKAAGFVSIFLSTRAGVTTSRFSLIASGLTAGAALELAINGADVQTVTPDKQGRVNVRTLPATVDIPGIKKIVIHDAANVNLLSASF